MIKYGILLFAASVCVAAACDSSYAPVCGNDGNTYPNECALNREQLNKVGLRVERLGACNGDDTPTAAHNTTPQAHNTPPQAHDTPPQAHNISTSSQSSCSCEGEAAPVCGHDHVTYHNECTMKCAGQDKKWDGPCAGRVRRRSIYDPRDDCNPNLGMPINIFRCKNKWF